MLRAAGDPTRLRLLLLLREAELAVSELIEIVGQTQPRVSRHLKLLGEAGLLERFKEGSWVFYRAADRGKGAELGRALAALADPGLIETDRARLAHVREARAAAAAAYFKANAAEWERIRALHAPEKDVEAAILRRLTAKPIEDLLDAGTGTGRMLELLAPHAKRAVGIDVSPEMLAIARDRLARENLPQVQVRLGDIYRLPFPDRQWRRRFRRRAVPSGAALSRRSRRRRRRSGAGDAAGRAAGHRRFRAAWAGIPARRLCPSPAGLFRPRSERLVRGGGPETRRQRNHRAHGQQGAAIAGKTHRQTLARHRAREGGGMSLETMIADRDAPISVSFEFSPPKTDEAEAALWATIKRLEPLRPALSRSPMARAARRASAPTPPSSALSRKPR